MEALLPYITHTHLALLSITKDLPFHFILNPLDWFQSQKEVKKISSKHIWARAWQNLQNGMCAHCPAKTDQLGIHPVWSESLLCAQYVAKDPSILCVDNKDSDQTGRMLRLIWVFAGCTCHFVGFVIRWLIFHLSKFNMKVLNLSAHQGPVVQSVTTLLVNDSLKFSSSDTQICWNFLLKKSE